MMIMGRNGTMMLNDGDDWLVMVDDGCLGRLGSYYVKLVITCTTVLLRQL